jgi:hypothetical protein
MIFDSRPGCVYKVTFLGEDIMLKALLNLFFSRCITVPDHASFEIKTPWIPRDPFKERSHDRPRYIVWTSADNEPWPRSKDFPEAYARFKAGQP